MRALLKPAEFARLCRVTQATVKAWGRRGLIRTIRLPGGRLRVHPDEAARVLGERQNEGSDDVNV